MLLQSITLNNVRSYKEQTIHFQEGITLLAGDIGSGKSTILHSIEFALFGASRPDLPAESLLRKGESKASVTLQLTINNQQIIIHRTLQNTPQGVRQGTGYIIQNNQKFELTAVELKAKMIELLGYPPELITKGKNYVFRYTIYCPQEEMKLILQESAENRLDILRKIFHVEKYKLVRENITLYLRTLRKEITILQTRCEQLPIKEAELLVAQDTVAVNKQELFLIEQKKVQLQTVFTDQQQLVEAIKQSVKEHQILQQEYFAIERSQLDLSEHQNKLAAKITNIISQRTSLLIDESHTAQSIEQEIQSVRSQLDQIHTKNHHFETSRDQLQSQIKELQLELAKSQESTNKLGPITDQINLNTKELEDYDPLVTEKEKIVHQINSDNLSKATIQSQILQLQEKYQKISSLTQCPTCEQTVPHEYCENITNQVTTEIQKLNGSLKQITDNELTNQNILETINLKLRDLQQVQLMQNKLLQEQAALQTFLSLHQQTHAKLKEKVVQNNLLMDKYQEFLSLEFPLQADLEKRILALQTRKEQTLLATQLKKQESEFNSEKILLDQKYQTQFVQIQNIKSQLDLLPDNSSKLLEVENSLELARNNLESVKIQYSKQDQIVIHQKQILLNLQTELDQLRITKTTLLKSEGLARWIDGQFIPLTGHIEREIMLKIYHYCNELFSEWFEMLTEGSELSGRLDSAFAPIIEQQGHEIAFAYLSGGERTAASLAYRLALTKAVNNVLQQINTKELLILDEPTDGFSAEQLQRLRDCLDAIGLKQIIIVSHEAMMEGFVNHIINVQKRSGVSSIN